jgi:hypothetical protein
MVGPFYLGGDFLLHVVYKAAGRDRQWWPPSFGVPMLLLCRFGEKVDTDSPACVHSRHPSTSVACTTPSTPCSAR